MEKNGGKLKVAVLTLYYLPRQGGAVTLINSFITDNDEADYTVFAPGYREGGQLVSSGQDVVLPPNTVIERMPLFRRRGFAALSYLFSCAIKRNLFKRSDFDVLHCISPPVTTAIAGALVSGSWRRILVDVGDPWVSGLYMGGFIKSKIAGRALSAMERWALRKARHVIYRSPIIESEFAGANTSSDVILTAPLPANEEKWELSEQQRLVYVGHMGPLYDLDPLLLSLRSIVEAFPDVHLELIGDGPTKPHLESLVRENFLDKYVTFSGTLTPDKARSRMRRSSISFIPLAGGPDHQYSMPVKLSESLSMGIPVIGWGTEGARQLIESSGGGVFTADPRPEIISQLVVEMLGDPHRLLRYSKSAIAFSAENLDRDKTQARINRIYAGIKEGAS